MADRLRLVEHADGVETTRPGGVGRHGGGDRPPATFVPVPLQHVPAPTVAELTRIFKDLDFDGRGHLTRAEVIAALAVNAIPLTEMQLVLLLGALDPDETGIIVLETFVTSMFALAMQHREVGEPAVYAVFPDSDFTTETATGWFKVKRWLWTLFDDPSSSFAARVLAYVLTAIILLSVATFIAETYPAARAANEQAFIGIEIFCVIVFTGEYLIRVLCTPTPRTFLVSFFNLVDLASIVPYYLELLIAGVVGSGAPLLRVLRLVRVFRLMKIGRYVGWMRVFGRTLEASARPLAMLAFVSALMIVLWSTMAYFVERGTWSNELGAWVNDAGEPSFFSSIPASFWWAIVSMSTVGYGDTYALTPGGRFLSACAILTGITLFAIPISIVTGNLHNEYARMDKLQRLRAEHHAQAQAAASVVDPVEAAAASIAAAASPVAATGGDADDIAPTGEVGSEFASATSAAALAGAGTGLSRRGVAGGGRDDATSEGGSGSHTGRGEAMLSARSTGHLHLRLPSQSSHRHGAGPPAAALAALRAPHVHAASGDGGGGSGDIKPVRHYTDMQLGIGGIAAAAPESPRAEASLSSDFPWSGTPQPSGTHAGGTPERIAAPRYLSGPGPGPGVGEFGGGTPSATPRHIAAPRYLSGPAAADSAVGGSSSTPRSLGAASDAVIGASRLLSSASMPGGSTPISPRAAVAPATARRFGDFTSPTQPVRAMRRLPTEGALRGFIGLAEGDGDDDDGDGTGVGVGAGVGATRRAAAADGLAASPAFAEQSRPQMVSTLQARVDASWSESFLRSTLQVVRGNRRRLMSSLKALELRNREHAVEDVHDFVADMSDPDRGAVIVRAAVASGLVA